jgi:hypothetical protein
VKTVMMVWILVIVFAAVPDAFARCWVQGGTLYATSKETMAKFDSAMKSGNQAEAQQMIADGRIQTCSEAACEIVERTFEGLLFVNVDGIGQVWTLEVYVHCT